MHLVQILLPLYDDRGAPFPGEAYRAVARELTERFGGVTAYTRAPAEGRWKDGAERETHDEIVVLEVMVQALDERWWAAYRKQLEDAFRQDAIVVRALAMRQL